jgi:ABC-type nitrate/sulfonate/bicarbonate transport system substrate-binding protein
VRGIGLVVALIAGMACHGAFAQTPAATPVRVITFNGGWDLPLWAAQRQGFFETNGVDVRLAYTPSSDALVAGLFDGRYDIALATIDNFIAYQEGQADVRIADATTDLVSFMGGDGGFLSVVSAPGVKTFADLKGKTLSVDAMGNGLAFVLRELLARNGVRETEVTFVRAGGTPNRYRDLVAGKHDATLLRTPFELLAQNRGFNVLATASSLGAYEGTVGAVRRSWARQNEATMIGFLRGYRSGVAWVCDPANREIAEALLVANIRDMTPALARQSYELLVAPQGGLARDVALDIEGIRTVLALRSRYSTPPRTLDDPARYIDTTYYDKAFGKR